MSVEVVSAHGRLYVIDGTPADGYDIHAVTATPFAHYDRKYEARRDLLHGRLEGPS